jgi:hypothetical protein
MFIAALLNLLVLWLPPSFLRDTICLPIYLPVQFTLWWMQIYGVIHCMLRDSHYDFVCLKWLTAHLIVVFSIPSILLIVYNSKSKNWLLELSKISCVLVATVLQLLWLIVLAAFHTDYKQQSYRAHPTLYRQIRILTAAVGIQTTFLLTVFALQLFFAQTDTVKSFVHICQLAFMIAQVIVCWLSLKQIRWLFAVGFVLNRPTFDEFYATVLREERQR